MKSPSTYLLIPVHNRKAVTLRCLDHLASLGALNRYTVIVIDDGSTDGTAAAIAAQFPAVTILPGNGNLWWTGAMELGMRHAHAHQARFILWLNDDTLPAPGTIEALIAFCQRHPRAIVASQCRDEVGPTYGGQHKTRFSQVPCHAAPGQTLECDALDGNLVCMPATVIDAIGLPEGRRFPHYGGDNMYTWRAKCQGFRLYVLGDAPSVCRRDHATERWLMDPDPVGKYWRKLGSPKSCFYWRVHPRFCLRYWGIAGLVPLVSPYLRLSLITLVRWVLPAATIRQLPARLQHLRQPWSKP